VSGVSDGSASSAETSTGGTDDACVEAHQAILTDLSQLAADRASGCSTDDDCVLIDPSIPCQDACGAAVVAAQAEAAEAAIQQYATEVCPTAPTTCGVSGTCPAARAACAEGRCIFDFSNAATP
jgi:hypothetical protein